MVYQQQIILNLLLQLQLILVILQHDLDHVAKLQELTEAEAGDLVLFVADKPSVVAQSLGALRLKLAKELDLIDETKLNFLWVTDWPLLEHLVYQQQIILNLLLQLQLILVILQHDLVQRI